MGRGVHLAFTTLLRSPFEGPDLYAQESTTISSCDRTFVTGNTPLLGCRPPSQGIMVIQHILLITSLLLILAIGKHHLYFCLFFFLLWILNVGVYEKMEQKKKSFLSYKMQQTMSKAEADEIRAFKKVLMGWTLLIRCISSRKCWSDIWSSREGCFEFP